MPKTEFYIAVLEIVELWMLYKSKRMKFESFIWGILCIIAQNLTSYKTIICSHRIKMNHQLSDVLRNFVWRLDEFFVWGPRKKSKFQLVTLGTVSFHCPKSLSGRKIPDNTSTQTIDLLSGQLLSGQCFGQCCRTII